jgi:hypothetical protein
MNPYNGYLESIPMGMFPTARDLKYGTETKGYRNGSAMAYSPEVDRLYLLWYLPGSASGNLCYVESPWNSANTALNYNWDYTASEGSTNTARAVRFVRNGSDHIVFAMRYRWMPAGQVGLMVLKPTYGMINTGRVLSPQPPSGPLANWTLDWDGGDYLYAAVEGTSSDSFTRMRIPDDPTVGSNWASAWETLPLPPFSRSGQTRWGPGMASAWTTSSVRGMRTELYPASETKYSRDVTPTPGQTQWGVASWAGTNTPGVTTVTVGLQGWNGAAYIDLPGFTDLPRSTTVDLMGMTTAAWPKMRFKAVYASAITTRSAQVTDWSLTCGSGRGTWVSPDIDPAGGHTAWDRAFLSAGPQPPGASLTYDVQAYNGLTWVDVPDKTGLQPGSWSLAELATVEYPKVRLVGRLWPGPCQHIGTIANAGVSSARAEQVPSGSMTCASCHNVHNVAGALTGVGDVGRVSDPQNTLLRATDVTSTLTGFCLRCHTASKTVRKQSSGTVYIPADVLFGVRPRSPYFSGYDKDAPGFSPYLGAHFTAKPAQTTCINCHDPHGSDNERLLAYTRPSAWTTGAPIVRDNSMAAAYEERLCLQCHGNGTTRGNQAPGAPNVGTAMETTNTHPTLAGASVHRDIETTAALGITNRHAECVDCHDPHVARTRSATPSTGTAAPGAIYGAWGVKPKWSTNESWTAAASYTPYRIRSGAFEAEAYLCLKCHSANVSQPTTGPSGATYPDLTVQFNPNNASMHNVWGDPAGVKESFSVNGVTYPWSFKGTFVAGSAWTKKSGVPCSGCHTSESLGARGPHGSSAKWMIDPAYNGDFKNAFWRPTRGPAPRRYTAASATSGATRRRSRSSAPSATTSRPPAATTRASATTAGTRTPPIRHTSTRAASTPAMGRATSATSRSRTAGSVRGCSPTPPTIPRTRRCRPASRACRSSPTRPNGCRTSAPATGARPTPTGTTTRRRQASGRRDLHLAYP